MTVCRPAWIVALALLLLPSLAEAQPSAEVPRIGVLSPAPSGAASASPFSVFREELRSLGYIEGKNIALEFRLADGKFERLPELAADLVRLRVNVIVTDGGDVVARAAATATKTIPIVFGTATDPVASGLVTSLAKPGGNVTGFVLSYQDLAGKRLQFLKEMVPAVSRVAVLWDAASGAGQFRETVAAAPRSASTSSRCQFAPPRISTVRSRRPVASVPALSSNWLRAGSLIARRRLPNSR